MFYIFTTPFVIFYNFCKSFVEFETFETEVLHFYKTFSKVILFVSDSFTFTFL